MSFTNSTVGTALNAPNNNRLLLDQNYITTINVGNAANRVNSSGLDLIQAVPYPVSTDSVDVNIVVTAGTGANNKNVNFWLQDSADNGNWTNTAFLANPLFQVTDNTNTNTNAANVTVKLQPNGQRYIRLSCIGEATGGVSTAVGTLQLLF